MAVISNAYFYLAINIILRNEYIVFGFEYVFEIERVSLMGFPFLLGEEE